MASVDLTDPQSLNLYTYARNNPIDFTDPTGLMTCRWWGLFYLYDDGSVVFIPGSEYLVCSGRVRPYRRSGGKYRRGSYGGNAPPKPQQDKYDCKFPKFSQLTTAQQSVLGNKGEAIYGKLSNRHRANFLNLTSRAAQIGLDFGNLIADPRDHVDRLILTGKLGPDGKLEKLEPADVLKASFESAVKARKMSDSPPIGHDGMNKYGGRQEGLTYSLQLGINQSRTEAFVDIDYYNPDNGLLGAGLHLGEVVKNWITKSKTDAFKVGKHLGSKLTKYDCKKIKK